MACETAHGILLWPHAEGADYDALFGATAAVGGKFAGFMPLAFESQAPWVTAAQQRWMMLAANAGISTYIGLRMHDAGTVVAPAGVTADPGDTDWRNAYAQACYDLALKYQPAHFNLAVEANSIYVAHPEQWSDFLAAFAAAKAAVKAASPGTIVYASISYELMIGAFGGDPHLDLLDGADTPAWERVGISTYPLWASTPYDPDEIPANYFAALQGLSLPVVIAETAWHTLEASGGTEAEQQSYVEALPSLLADVVPELVLWVNARDAVETPNVIEPRFDRLGLLDWEGNAKPAMSAWSAANGDELEGCPSMTTTFKQTNHAAACGASAGASGAMLAPTPATSQAHPSGLPASAESDVGLTGGSVIEAAIMLQASPRQAVWAAGTYTVRLNLTTASTLGAALVHVFVYRFDDECGVLEQVGLAIPSVALDTPGVIAVNVTGAESTGSDTDTLYVVCTVFSSSAETIGVTFDQELGTPIVQTTKAVIAAERTSLPWPDPVFLHADASTLAAGTRQTATYIWHRDDTDETVRGPEFSFYATETVTVTLTVIDEEGNQDTAQQEITVTAEAVTLDYYVADAGNDTTGDGSQGNPWKTIAKAISEIDSNWSENTLNRINLNRGDTFQTATGWSENGHQGKFILGAYGTGGAPILEYTGTDFFFVFDTACAVEVRDVWVRGQYDADNDSGNAPSALFRILANGGWADEAVQSNRYRLTVRNARLSGADVAIITDTYSIQWVGDTGDPLSSYETKYTGGVFIEGAHIHDCKTNNVYLAKTVWLGVHDTVIEHCRTGHVLRIAGAKFFDIRNVDLFDPAFAASGAGNSRHCLKLHGEVDDTNRFMTRYGYVSGLRVRGGHWCIMVAPQDAGKDEWGSDVIFDGVTSQEIVASSGSVPTGRLFTIAWPRVTIRNVFGVLDSASSDPSLVWHAHYTSITGEKPTDLLVENVSGYHGGGGTTSAALLETGQTFAPGSVEGAASEGAITGVRLRNCVLKQTGTGTARAAVYVRGGGVGATVSEMDHNCYDLAQGRLGLIGATPYADLAAWRAAVGTFEADSIAADPLFVDAAAGNLHVSENSPLIGAGFSYGSNRYDADGEEREGALALATIGADGIPVPQASSVAGRGVVAPPPFRPVFVDPMAFPWLRPWVDAEIESEARR